MFPDYNTFVSYHPCQNKPVQLGDSTELPILGYGTAKFSLNGRVILVRNALNVPGLTNRKVADSSPIMILEHFSSSWILLLKWMIGLTAYLILNLYWPQPFFQNQLCQPSVLYPIGASDSDLDKISFHIPTPNTSSPSSPTNPAMSPDSTAISSILPSIVEQSDLQVTLTNPLTKQIMDAIHHNPCDIPPIPPSYTPAACENRTTFNWLNLHKIFSCQKFRT